MIVINFWQHPSDESIEILDLKERNRSSLDIESDEWNEVCEMLKSKDINLKRLKQIASLKIDERFPVVKHSDYPTPVATFVISEDGSWFRYPKRK